MSKLGFFTKMAGAGLKEIGDAITVAVATRFPELASEAQIGEFAEHVDELAELVAKSEAKADEDEAKVRALEEKVAKYGKAIDSLGAKLEASPSDKSLAEAVDKLLDEEAAAKQELADWQAAAADSRAYATEKKGQHAAAATRLKNARRDLEMKRRELERSEEQRQRAEERKRDEQRAAGIVNEVDSMDTALSAFDARIAANKQAARAADLTSDALGGSAASDALVRQALAEAEGAPAPASSALERLRARRGG